MDGPCGQTVLAAVLKTQYSWSNHFNYAGHSSAYHLDKRSRHGSSNRSVLSSDICADILYGFIFLGEVLEASQASQDEG